jgi:hypothetical protein
MDSRRLQGEVNRRVSEHVPPHGWSATVAIVIANRPAVYLLGTGSLFEIGGCHFVVTAAHVVSAAHICDRTIAVSDGADSFLSVHGSWIVSAPVQSRGLEDPFDVAVYRLPADAMLRLEGKRFLRPEDIDFNEQSKTAVFTLFGFPGMWAMPSHRADEAVSLKPLEFTTYAYEGGAKPLSGYDPRYHLLLDSTDKDMTELDGSQAVVVRRDGRTAELPIDLKGISGCAVWVVGDLDVPLERWCERAPKVVAVETSVVQKRQVVQATRWIAVTTLISEAFPEVRRAMGR